MAKKIPMRKCIACNTKKEKKDLLRVVNNKEEGIVIDNTGKKNGRGAYICKNPDCIQKAQDNKLLSRALNAKIENDLYKEILDYVD